MAVDALLFQTKTVLTEDRHRIAYDHYPRGHSAVVIIAPGFFNGRRGVLFKEMAARLSDRYDVMVLDFRGHGDSEGLFTWTAKEYLDLQALVKAARKEYSRVALLGFSLGAATSIITAALPGQVDALIAVSAPCRFERIDYRFWEMDVEENIFFNLLGEGRTGKGVRPGPFWLKKYSPVEMIAQVRCPTLLIHGGKDWLIRPWHSRELFEKAVCPKKLHILPEGTHAEFLFRREREGLTGLFKDWLSGTMAGPSSG